LDSGSRPLVASLALRKSLPARLWAAHFVRLRLA
jgi:hypothetical protein